jgi:ABC-2 type transport system permease protein
LVVVSSAEFLDDLIFKISQSVSGDRYQSNLQMVQNMVDWATEDADMLAIRARGTTSRLFIPLPEIAQKAFEWGNYIMAIVALAVVGAVWTMRRRGEQPMVLIAPDTARDAEAK